MDFDQLEAFVTLSRTKNFSRAAELLHIVQSAISTRIRLLEESVGRSLFDRDNRTVRLTDAGQMFLPKAEELLQRRREALFQLQNRNLYAERLRVAAPDCLWRNLLLRSLVRISDKYPTLALTASTAHSHEVISMLQANQIDVGIVLEKPRLTGIDTRKIANSKIILVGSPNLKLGRKALSKEELNKLTFVSLGGDETMDNGQPAFPGLAFPRVQFDQLDMMLEFVKSGNGVAYVPEFAAKLYLQSGQLVKIHLEKTIKLPTWTIFFISRKVDRNRASIKNILNEFTP